MLTGTLCLTGSGRRLPAWSGGMPDPPDREVVVVVRGELDLATVPAVRRRLLGALRRRPDRLVLDVSGCAFADCTALTLLLQVQRSATRQGVALVLRRPSPALRRLIDVTGTALLLPSEDR